MVYLDSIARHVRCFVQAFEWIARYTCCPNYFSGCDDTTIWKGNRLIAYIRNPGVLMMLTPISARNFSAAIPDFSDMPVQAGATMDEENLYFFMVQFQVFFG